MIIVISYIGRGFYIRKSITLTHVCIAIFWTNRIDQRIRAVERKTLITYDIFIKNYK